MNKKDPIKFFNSFACRHFVINFASKQTVDGIDTYQYTYNKDNFNPYVAPNYGFVCYHLANGTFFSYKFDNPENANYFPDWPCGKNITQVGNCAQYNCSLMANLCTSCCNRSSVPFPPGMVAQKCFPGQNRTIPFTALLSLPHFYGTDDSVIKSMNGPTPLESNHTMGEFNLHPVRLNDFIKISELRLRFLPVKRRLESVRKTPFEISWSLLTTEGLI